MSGAAPDGGDWRREWIRAYCAAPRYGFRPGPFGSGATRDPFSAWRSRAQPGYAQTGAEAIVNAPAGYRPSLAIVRSLARCSQGVPLDELELHQLRRADLIDRAGDLTELGCACLDRASLQFDMAEARRG